MKKRIFISILTAMFTGTIIFSCKKEKTMLFNSDASAYFFKPWITIGQSYLFIRDSALICLGYTDDDSVFTLPVKLFGRSESSNRKYNLSVDTDSTTASEGSDYTLSGNREIAASQYYDTLIFTFKNRHLDTVIPLKYLYLSLKSNQNFNTDLQDAYSSTGTLENIYNYKIIIDYKARMPYFWQANTDYLGTYTKTKLKAMIKQQNMRIQQVADSLNGTYSYNTSSIDKVAVAFQSYLNAQKQNGNIILDEDGQPMVMGEKAVAISEQ